MAHKLHGTIMEHFHSHYGGQLHSMVGLKMQDCLSGLPPGMKWLGALDQEHFLQIARVTSQLNKWLKLSMRMVTITPVCPFSYVSDDGK